MYEHLLLCANINFQFFINDILLCKNIHFQFFMYMNLLLCRNIDFQTTHDKRQYYLVKQTTKIKTINHKEETDKLLCDGRTIKASNIKIGDCLRNSRVYYVYHHYDFIQYKI